MYKLSAKSYMQIHLVKEGEKNVMPTFPCKKVANIMNMFVPFQQTKTGVCC